MHVARTATQQGIVVVIETDANDAMLLRARMPQSAGALGLRLG
jgi:hypothetical protein